MKELSGYTKYFGPDFSGEVRLMECHQHARVKYSDGVISPEQVVDTAEELGVDLALTDHDTLEGFDRALRRRDNSGYSLKIIPAVEYTARGDQGEHRHIIALNPQHMIASGLHYTEANRQFHRQNAKVVAVHPELSNYSMLHTEIKRACSNSEDPEQRFDGLEIANGGVSKAYAVTQMRFLRHITSHISALPQKDLNAQSRAIFQANGHQLFAYGGSDGHSAKEIGDVVMVRPSELEPLEAIESGNTAIYIRDNPSRVSLLDYLSKLGLNFLDKYRNESKNDIINHYGR